MNRALAGPLTWRGRRISTWGTSFVLLLALKSAGCAPSTTERGDDDSAAEAAGAGEEEGTLTTPDLAARHHSGAVSFFDPTLEVERPEGVVIDAHSHLISPSSWPAIETVMEDNHIGYYFNMSGGSPRDGITNALALGELSNNRILNFMTINWDGVDEVAFGEILADELELCVTEYGYAGLKVSKALGLFARDGYGELIPVNDPRLFPLWERAGDLGVPVFIHTSDPLAFWDPITPENERYAELSVHPGWSFADPEYPPRAELLAQRDDLLARFPDTRFVGVHFANNPEDLTYVAEALERYPNLYVDLAARIPELGRHDPDEVRAIFERFGDRILFATDIVMATGRDHAMHYILGSAGETPDTAAMVTPFYDRSWQYLETDDQNIAHPTPIQGDWTVDAIGLSEELLDQVYYENAYRLVVAPWLARRGVDGSPRGE